MGIGAEKVRLRPKMKRKTILSKPVFTTTSPLTGQHREAAELLCVKVQPLCELGAKFVY